MYYEVTYNGDKKISIHAPRVRCDKIRMIQVVQSLKISIHAPRVRCDSVVKQFPVCLLNFNPRTSCEVRLDRVIAKMGGVEFQSTHLV